MDAPAVTRATPAAPRPRPSAGVNLPDATETRAGLRFGVRLARLEKGDLAGLRRIVEDATLDDVADEARFSPEGYARVLLARSEHAEVLVLGWLPGQASPVHDHGLSHGFAKVLAGEGAEDSFALGEGRAVLAERRGIGAGDVLVERPDQVHRLVQQGSNVLITVHAYAPCLRDVRTYDE